MDQYSHNETYLVKVSGWIAKYIRQEISVEEQRLLELWLKEDIGNEAIFDRIVDEQSVKSGLLEMQQIDVSKGWAALLAKESKQTVHISSHKRKWWRYAAAVLLPLGLLTVLFLKQKNEPVDEAIVSHYYNDVAPGTSKATLTLGNGQVIVLDETAQGDLGFHEGTRMQNDSALLRYEARDDQDSEVTYNTFTTPVGGSYALVLSDGTKVWLNALSSLRFPTRFTGQHRTVILEGEAYFEVVTQPGKHFMVTTGEGINVEVLGTHFNIMSYPDEKKMITTLLEGKVELKREGDLATYTLQPGEAAHYNKSDRKTHISNADVDEAVAWKNNIFLFNNDNLTDIMRRLERWYDVKVEYNGKTKVNSHFTGGVRRRENISKVLEMLEMTGGAKFELKDKKVTVLSQ